MSFEQRIINGSIKPIPIDNIRAKGLIKSSRQAIETARAIPLNQTTGKSILRELYEGLRQYLEALGYKKGYKFLSHEAITYFVKEILNNEEIALKFDRYRRIRNKINYYGEDISLETVKQALEDFPMILDKLKSHE